VSRWNQGRSTVDALYEAVRGAADVAKVEALIGLAEKAIPNMPRY
jgi:hypothetical protein